MRPKSHRLPFCGKLITFFHSCHGQEAPGTALGLSLNKDDFIFYNHRDHGLPKVMPKGMSAKTRGPIEVEFASSFQIFGVQVTIVTPDLRILLREDKETCQRVAQGLRDLGVKIIPQTRLESVDSNNSSFTALLKGAEEKTLKTDRILLCARKPNTERLGLENAGIHCDEEGYIRVNEKLETSQGGVYAVGDCTGGWMLSHAASAMMAEMDVALIVTLGGDGTNRAVAKSCGDIPLLPISTGTNNVFPFMVEGTLAGLAAGVVATNKLPRQGLFKRTWRLEIFNGSELMDIALVDVVVSKSDFIGTKAIWDVKTLKEIFLTRSHPNNIGFSSVRFICGRPHNVIFNGGINKCLTRLYFKKRFR